ncbi:hypothetical protein HNR77_002150 [Paenibacillus sp. JGP012]|nr:hypothetical protein [Paenibacillus sp. JGP012]
MRSAERCTRRSSMDVPVSVRLSWGCSRKVQNCHSKQACNTLGKGMLSSVLSYLNRQGHGADIEYKDRWLMPVVFFWFMEL